MADKSPRQSMSKKIAGKSIKEKRRDKKAAAGGASEMEKLTEVKGKRR